MDKDRLTWEQIQQRYPNQFVGLVDVEYGAHKVEIKSAVVKYSEENSTRDEICLLTVQHKVQEMRLTTQDTDYQLSVNGLMVSIYDELGITEVSDGEVELISRCLMERNKHVYEELAK